MAGKDKKPRGRRAYLQYFTPTVGGGYVYNGPMVPCRTPRAARRRLLAALGALLAAVTGCTALPGLVPVPGMQGCFYVILPWLGQLAGTVFLLGAGRLVPWLWDADALRRYRYEATAPKLPLRAACTAVCAGLAAVGEAVCLLRQGAGGNAGGAVLFFGCQLCAAVAAAGAGRLARRLAFDPLDETPPPAQGPRP